MSIVSNTAQALESLREGLHSWCPGFIRLSALFVLGSVLGGGILAQTQETPKRWSVLMITVDCLRPDHMSVYGYARDTTPNLAKLAQESMVFEKAFSSSAWTTPSLSSLMTGYQPTVHGQNGRFGFYDKLMPAPLRLLTDAGYDIYGSDIKGPGHEDFGFGGKPANDRPYLENFIESPRALNPRPFFTWVHLDDVHLPYTPTAKNANRWLDTSSSSEGIQAVREHKVILRTPQEGLPFKHAGKVSFVPADTPIVRALYDGELADLDERLGAVFERMRANRLWDRTIVIVSADHGEELFEHGWLGHASTNYDGKLYDELIHIPLIIHLPDGARAGRSGALVQGVDLMPTLLALLSIDASKISPPMQGSSLLALGGERKELHARLFTQTTLKGWTATKDEVKRRIRAVRTLDRKLIAFPQTDGYRYEAYDLKADPGEKKNLYPSRKKKFADLEKSLADWDEENAAIAARLVQGTADKYLAALEQALQVGDLLTAMRAWEAVEVMQQTWDLEPQPFFNRPPYAEPWKALRRRMSGEITAALECANRDKTFRFVTTSGTDGAASIACE